MSSRNWFAPGQVWRPCRGRQGPRLQVVNVHRVDRLVEVIDAESNDRLTAKRRLLRFGEMRAGWRLEAEAPSAAEPSAASTDRTRKSRGGFSEAGGRSRARIPEGKR